MKKYLLLLAWFFTIQLLPAQLERNGPSGPRAVSYSPLFLLTNGMGRIVPFQNGELLENGHRCVMAAIPEHGYVFAGWQPVNVFSFTEYTQDGSGNWVENTSRVLEPIPQYTSEPALRFIMQPEQVLFNLPNVRMITLDFGWQANFVPAQRRDR